MSLRYALKSAKAFLTQSNQRKTAWLLLIGVVIATLGFSLLMVQMSTVFGLCYAALAAMDKALLFSSVVNFAGVGLVSAACYYMNHWCQTRLKTAWREWMFGHLNSKLLLLEEDKKSLFADIFRFPAHNPNPGYTLQYAVRDFASSSIDMTIGIFSSAVHFGTSVGLLWSLGGALSFTLFGAMITVPGFLVWAALLFSAVSLIATRLIGHKLTEFTKAQQNAEAGLTQDLTAVEKNAESIALERGQVFYKNRLQTDIASVSKNTVNQQDAENKVNALGFFLYLASSIFPYLAAAPLYFRGLINVGSITQIQLLFGQVNTALSFFANQYIDLAIYNANAGRLEKLERNLEQGVTAPRTISVQTRKDHPRIEIHQLTVTTPCDEKEEIMSNLSLAIRQGESTLIEGRNGCGKSTLLKVLAKTYAYGRGNITVPSDLFFCPQHPVIPQETRLRAILAYPEINLAAFSDEAVKNALTDVGLDALYPYLDADSVDWKNQLSGGEAQLLAFARVLLHKPGWVAFDETTSALTPENEREMYNLIKEKLPNTTIISIGHRPSLRFYHDRILQLEKLTKAKTVAIDVPRSKLTLFKKRNSSCPPAVRSDPVFKSALRMGSP